MNITHLKFALEVNKTHSISKAAENLYMSQPNLSRAIKELEDNVGISIFRRTSKGIVATESGEDFLMHAESIIHQIDSLENSYHEKGNFQRFSISIPRVSYINKAFVDFVNELDAQKGMEINFKETNALRTINNVLNDGYHIGIIRYQTIYENYFMDMFEEKGIASTKIAECKMYALVSINSSLADKEYLKVEELRNYIEIVHGDPYVPSLSVQDLKRQDSLYKNNKKIAVYERATQFDLLSSNPNAFMLVSSVPTDLLHRFSLVQLEIKDYQNTCTDVLIYKKNYKLTSIDKHFIDKLVEVKRIYIHD